MSAHERERERKRERECERENTHVCAVLFDFFVCLCNRHLRRLPVTTDYVRHFRSRDLRNYSQDKADVVDDDDGAGRLDGGDAEGRHR